MEKCVVPLREFVVRPALPPSISKLIEIAYNLVWSWDHSIRAVFRRLDPTLWKECNHNPVLLLGRVSQETLNKWASDPRYLAQYRRACERYDTYLRKRDHKSDSPLIAYFSMEYGLLDCMQIYSGGLGVLSGDHLKAASDSDMPLVGVGLLYQKGYLQQALNSDGWQQERNPINDFYTLPVRPVLTESGQDVLVSVRLPIGETWIKVWHIDVGRVRLFLLDTNIVQNLRAEQRDITDRLYGGDHHERIRQEIVLGIGGLRALKKLGIKPTVFHMNEGHSAFLAIERMRRLMEENDLDFTAALEASRLNTVFTTHTCVPAGIDIFDNGLIYEYFEPYCKEAGISFDQFLSLGRTSTEYSSERFSMAVLALRTAAFRNAVSVLHKRVSQEMFQELWPKLPADEVPITSITNGVHAPTWINGDLGMLYDQYLQPDWRERLEDRKMWELVHEIPNQELWEVHRKRKRRLVSFVRERATRSATSRGSSAAEVRRVSEVLDPDVLTIGFARRFATYKRATLLFRDVHRLKKILSNPDMPVQIVVAGKAHPKDHPGKALIREIANLSRDPELARRLVFVEDYGIQVARELVQGVDLWLNNPRRGEEACGTSGMKAAMNGVLNLSILDGWFDEAYECSGSWAIGGREPYSDYQDEIHATDIYSKLENEIVPAYYQGVDKGVPHEWIRRMKRSLSEVTPRFSSGRMVAEYLDQLYLPAHRLWGKISENKFAEALKKSAWDTRLTEVWRQIQFIDIGGPSEAVISGSPVTIRAVVDLAGLQPSELRVEAILGQVGAGGQLENPEILTLEPVEQSGEAYVFCSQHIVERTGRLGYAVRVCQDHFENALTRPCNPLLTWASVT